MKTKLTKNILVTGVAGFIGFSLALKLLKQKHMVVGIDNLDDYYSVKLKKKRLIELKKYKNIDSKLLLGKVVELCNKKGYKLSNADITILLQEPKISKYKVKIIEVLSGILNVDHSKISVKATTTEGLGFVGREEGVAAHCVVIMEVL